jgi:hypothetical protein
MIPLERVMGEYLYRLRRLTEVRTAWKNDPSLPNLLAYLVAVETMNTRRRHADIIRTIEFPDVRKAA